MVLSRGPSPPATVVSDISRRERERERERGRERERERERETSACCCCCRGGEIRGSAPEKSSQVEGGGGASNSGTRLMEDAWSAPVCTVCVCVGRA